MELERQQNILIIGHQAILRCIYAYFMNQSHEKLPYIKIPLHTVIQLTPRAYACDEKRFKVDIGAVDTHRPKPKNTVVKATAEPAVEIHPERVTPIEKATSGECEKDAAITTTTTSTTTFKDSAFQRGKNFYRLSTDAKAKTDPLLDKAKALQSALAAVVASDSLANPAVALPLDQIKTPEPESSNTPPMSPLQIPSAMESDSAKTPASEQNLSIETKDLSNPPLARLKSDLNLVEWQEGPEYEKTAGASPRDPVMSPGGRLLPKMKDNWHFPVSSFCRCLLGVCGRKILITLPSTPLLL